jgi:hypothetical protein
MLGRLINGAIGEIRIVRGNLQRCPPQFLRGLEWNLGRRGWKQATDFLRYGMACIRHKMRNSNIFTYIVR